MMAAGKMGPRGRRTRPQAEPFAQRRGRVRQDYLLMEPVAVLSNKYRSPHSPRSIELSLTIPVHLD